MSDFLCDVCSDPIDVESSFMLSTREVLLSSGYWRRWCEITFLGQIAADLDPDVIAQWIDSSLERLADSKTPWLLCLSCVFALATEPAEGQMGDIRTNGLQRCQQYAATGKVPEIPGLGPLTEDEAMTARLLAAEVVDSFWGGGR